MRLPLAPLLTAVVLISLSHSVLPSAATAQQPLVEFLLAAKEHALDVREARAARSQAESQVAEARARLLPSLVGQTAYQRNYPVISVTVPTGMVDAMGVPITRQAAITPADQLGATATATVPLLDLSAWAGYSSASANRDAVDANQEVVQGTVAITVVQLWYALVAQRALVDAAQRNLEASQKSRDAVAARVEVGVSGQLELARTEAELARAKQSFEEARLQATLTARALADLTGLTPNDSVATLAISPGDARAPLQDLAQKVQYLPAVRAAREQARAAEIAEDGAWMALLPSLAANSAARWTNASGFAKQYAYYVGVSATWTLDFIKPARIGTTGAVLEGAQIRALRAEQQTQTAIFDTWHRVETARSSVEALLVAQSASQRAVQDALARYENGTATQLDLIQAQRDAFQADVAVIQAVANLHVARAVLDIRLGETPH